LIGKRLLHYEVTEKLGEGGMGVVYKARDTHLDRFVAIKVLPPECVADASRKARFVQEAKAASALNHPNIVTIHDISSDAGTDFIAMEFVSGKTLDQLIPRKGMRLNDVLKIAIQIADALARAHAARIIHRDLKPANIMVDEHGLVKVLDFGLAKLSEREPDEFAPTETLNPQTEEGTIVGTAGYMSPEQAEGKKLDARSDIFSFGSVLYEMLTGRRAFRGDSKLATLSAILHQEPAPLQDVPPELEKLVLRCLRKDPERRTQHLADVKLALEDLKEESDSGKLRVPRQAPGRRTARWAIPAAIVLVLATAEAARWLWHAPEAAAPTVLTRLTSDTGLTTDPALSPDDKLLAYVSDRAGEGRLNIYVRQVGGGEPLRLTRDPTNERGPSFSPDGTTVAYHSEQDGGGIYVVSALGGAARKIASGGWWPKFSPDGAWIAYMTGGINAESASFGAGRLLRSYIVPSAGGTPSELQPGFASVAFPTWSPDGKHILFLGKPDEQSPADETVDWWITPSEPGPAVRTGLTAVLRRERLTGPSSVYPWVLVSPVWEPRGDSLLFSARSGDSTNLWRFGISPKTWKATGSAQRLTSGTTQEELPSAALGSDGAVRVAFASLSDNSDIWSLDVDWGQGKARGEPQRLTSDAARNRSPGLSADRTRMVFISARSGSEEIWIRDLGSGREFALTASKTQKHGPRFAPDGSKVSFSSREPDGTWSIYVAPSSGGVAESLCKGCGVGGWSPDGKYIAHNDVQGRAGVLEVVSRRRTELLVQPGYFMCCLSFSPDGGWISFVAWTSGSGSAFVAPFSPGGLMPEAKWGRSVADSPVAWAPRGDWLHFISPHDGYPCLWAQRLDPSTKRPLGTRVALYHAHGRPRPRGDEGGGGVRLSPDSIVFPLSDQTGNIWMVTLPKYQ
jgi:serine/threonine protein kinase/Tol biopolymer transport system component